VGANTSYTHLTAKMRQRMMHLHVLGVGFIMVPGATCVGRPREAASHGNVAHKFRLRDAGRLKEGHVCAGGNVSRTHLHEQCHQVVA
jgi:hypothetical protein